MLPEDIEGNHASSSTAQPHRHGLSAAVDGGTQPSKVSSAARTQSDLRYLESVEKELLTSIQKLQSKLTATRSGSHGRPRRLHRRNPSDLGSSPGPLGRPTAIRDPRGNGLATQSNPALDAAHGFGAPSIHGGPNGRERPSVAFGPNQYFATSQSQEGPTRQRIITVSLHLPTKADRKAGRQQLFDSRLPPKAMFALERDPSLTFVWVGATDPSLTTNEHDEAFEEIYETSDSTRWRSHGFEDINDVTAPKAKSMMFPVSLPEGPELMESFLTFCDRTLWNLLHYDYSSLSMDDEMGEFEERWNAYRLVNQRFAEAVCEIYEDGDLIWVHNYHLMLVPSMLRARLWYARIGFFLYSPFPSAEIFRILPFRTELLKGVLGADLAGFHTYDYSKQFAASCTRLLGLESTPTGIEAEPRSARRCEFGIYPAGVAVRDLKALLQSKSVKSRISELRRRFADKKVIVGIDRLDDAFAGIPLRLLAFERFLADNPAWLGKVVLVQIARIDKHSGRAGTSHRAEINISISRINSQFGTLAFSPVHYINEELEAEELYSLMCVGHVCIVSSVRDGMSLIPYEWTVCQHDGNKGCLILSEFAGAAASFATALHVNPWNVDDVAGLILRALEMNEPERTMRDASAYTFVATHTARLWGLNFIEDLEAVNNTAASPGPVSAHVLDEQAVLDAYLTAPSAPSSTLPSPVSTPAALALAISPLPASSPLGSESSLPEMTSSSSIPVWRTATRRPNRRRNSTGSSKKGRKKLFVLDYDGTLVPFQAIKDLVAPAPQTLSLLQNLSAPDSNYVILMSGRDRDTMIEWFGHLNVFLVAEDGAFVRAPGSTEWVTLFRRSSDDDYGMRPHLNVADSSSPAMTGLQASTPAQKGSTDASYAGRPADRPAEEDANGAMPLREGSNPRHGEESGRGHGESDTANSDNASRIGELLASSASLGRRKMSVSSFGSQGLADSGGNPEWKVHVMPIMLHFAERTPGVVLEEGEASLTWHYIDADPEFGQLQARDLQKHLESFFMQHFSFEVVSEEGSRRQPTRWVRVRPSGVGKAVALKRCLDWIREDVEGEETDNSVDLVLRNDVVHSGPEPMVRAESSQSLMLNAFPADALERHPAGDLGADPFQASPSREFPDPDIRRSPTPKDFRLSSSRPASLGRLRDAALAGHSSRHTGGGTDAKQLIFDFVLCVGDDRSDEDMFDLLTDEEKVAQMGLAPIFPRMFTCRIGPGPTSADATLDTPQRLVELLERIVTPSPSPPPLNEMPSPREAFAAELGRERVYSHHPGSW